MCHLCVSSTGIDIVIRYVSIETNVNDLSAVSMF